MLSNVILDYLTLDNILRGATIVGGVVGFIIYLRTELMSLRKDMTYIKDHQDNLMDGIKQLNTILTQIAVQEVRLNMIEKNVDELRHGKGYIS